MRSRWMLPFFVFGLSYGCGKPGDVSKESAPAAAAPISSDQAQSAASNFALILPPTLEVNATPLPDKGNGLDFALIDYSDAEVAPELKDYLVDGRLLIATDKGRMSFQAENSQMALTGPSITNEPASTQSRASSGSSGSSGSNKPSKGSILKELSKKSVDSKEATSDLSRAAFGYSMDPKRITSNAKIEAIGAGPGTTYTLKLAEGTDAQQRLFTKVMPIATAAGPAAEVMNTATKNQPTWSTIKDRGVDRIKYNVEVGENAVSVTKTVELNDTKTGRKGLLKYKFEQTSLDDSAKVTVTFERPGKYLGWLSRKISKFTYASDFTPENSSSPNIVAAALTEDPSSSAAQDDKIYTIVIENSVGAEIQAHITAMNLALSNLFTENSINFGANKNNELEFKAEVKDVTFSETRGYVVDQTTLDLAPNLVLKIPAQNTTAIHLVPASASNN